MLGVKNIFTFSDMNSMQHIIKIYKLIHTMLTSNNIKCIHLNGTEQSSLLRVLSSILQFYLWCAGQNNTSPKQLTTIRVHIIIPVVSYRGS